METTGELILRYATLPFAGVNRVEWSFDDLGTEEYQVLATPSWFTAVRIFEKTKNKVTIMAGSPGSPSDFIDIILIKQK